MSVTSTDTWLMLAPLSVAADAEAICEAVRRPTMRFVQVKSAEQQGGLMLHRTRDLLMRQRTQGINALRAHLAELGITAAQGREGLKELLKIIASDADERLPADAHASLVVLAAALRAMQTLIGSIEKRIMAQHRGNEASQRLESIPGIGVIGATAIAATVPDPKVFRSGRDFAAWIGLVPREDSTGGKQKLGPISKQGDQYLRRILIVGAGATGQVFGSWLRQGGADVTYYVRDTYRADLEREPAAAAQPQGHHTLTLWGRDTQPYQRWIDTYRDEGFGDSVRQVLDHTDRAFAQANVADRAAMAQARAEAVLGMSAGVEPRRAAR